MSVMPMQLFQQLVSPVVFFTIGAVMPKTKPCKIMPLNKAHRCMTNDGYQDMGC